MACHLHVLNVYNCGKPQPPKALTACPGLYRERFTFCIGELVYINHENRRQLLKVNVLMCSRISMSAENKLR